jgi:hypothetical protein
MEELFHKVHNYYFTRHLTGSLIGVMPSCFLIRNCPKCWKTALTM